MLRVPLTIAALAVAFVGLTVSPAAARSNHTHGHNDPPCNVTAGPMDGRDGTWLTITDTLTPATFYVITVNEPNGAATGDAIFPDADTGALVDTNIAVDPTVTGEYDVTISPWPGGSTVSSCSVAP